MNRNHSSGEAGGTGEQEMEIEEQSSRDIVLKREN
jgi:hypothetical protein